MLRFVIGSVLIVTLIGCSQPGPSSENGSEERTDDLSMSDSAEIRSAADLAKQGSEPAVGSDAFNGVRTPLPGTAERAGNDLAKQIASSGGSGGASSAPSPGDLPSALGGGFMLAPNRNASDSGMQGEGDGSTLAPTSGFLGKLRNRDLNDSLSPEALIDFLKACDSDMRTIATGRSQIEDSQEASDMMIALADKKGQAAVRLSEHPDADEEQQVAGTRGQLQALSHLAAMGNVRAAETLESFAQENLESQVPSIAMDSRIVLLGFAIDDLHLGRDGAADKIIGLAQGMKSSPSSDVPAILILGKARQTLSSYGEIDSAITVRELILSVYGSAESEMIRNVAKQAAGNVLFDDIERMLAANREDERVDGEAWSNAISDLLLDLPNQESVQYVMRAALEFEATEQLDIVDETYQVLEESVPASAKAIRDEMEIAQQAMAARKRVIGTTFDFARLPTVNGDGVPFADINEKIVLMPFWAVSIPPSLQVMNELKALRDKYPDQVSIVGMNLDPAAAPLKEFTLQNDLGFSSYRSASSSDPSVANPVAARFGIVSFPFVAVFNQAGRVAALDFTGTRLKEIVQELAK